jgi:AcrR family transcriptional regulator
MKEEIIKISLARFLTYGIRKMTIQKLVSPLGISTKTVYKFFRNKEELLRECLIVQYDRLLTELFTIIDHNPNAVVAMENGWEHIVDADFGVNMAFYRDLNYYYPALQDEIINVYDHKISNAVVKLIKRGMDDGVFMKGLHPQLIYEAMMVLYSSLTRTDRFKKYRMESRALFRQTVFVYLRGICTEKGVISLTDYSG